MIDIILEMIESSYVLVLIALAIFYVVGMFIWYSKMERSVLKIQQELQKDEYKESTPDERIHLFNVWIYKQKLPKIIVSKWSDFYGEYRNYSGKLIPDIYHHFVEEELVNKYGFRKLAESVPAVFVSLGILGTFYGISTGVSDLDPTGPSDELKDGINILLSGMKVAFYSSIAGICLSLMIQAFDKLLLYPKLQTNFYSMRNQLEKQFPIKSEESLLEELVDIQKTQMDDLKTFLADEMIAKMTSGISDIVVEGLNPHLQKSNEIMEQVVQNTQSAHSEKMNEMVEYFVNSLNEVTGDHMKELGNALNKTIEWQEKVHGEMSGLVEELKIVAVQQSEMAKNTTELTDKMNNYTETLGEYQEKLVDSTTGLHEVTEQSRQLLDSMRELQQEVQEERKDFETRFIEQLNQLNVVVEHLNQSTESMESLQMLNQGFLETFNDSTTVLTNLTQNQVDLTENTTDLSNNLTEQLKSSTEVNEQLNEMLTEIAENHQVSSRMQNHFEELFKLISTEYSRIDDSKEQFMNQLKGQLEQMDLRVNGLKSFWTTNHEELTKNRELFTSINQKLDGSMENFANNMHQGLGRTFDQFDKQLGKSVEYLERGINSIRTVIETMEGDIEQVNSTVTQFNQAIKQVSATKVIGSDK